MTTPPSFCLTPLSAFLLLLFGVLLLATAYSAETLSFAPLAEWLGHVVYRILFAVSLPILIVSQAFTGGDYSLHWLVWALVCFGLPTIVWMKWRSRSRIEAQVDATSRSRRHFLRTSAKIAGLATAGVGVDAVAFAPERLKIRRYEIPIEGLPSSLEGLRLVQISDTHYGPFISLSYLREVIATANALAPDVILLTGDYVHKTSRAVHDGIGIFADLKYHLGIVGVLGNHDHWEGADACRNRFADVGIPLIDNRRLFLTPHGMTGKWEEDALCLAGVGDLWEDLVDVRGALRDVPSSTPRLLLSHNPDVAESLPGDVRIDLMLSGHTHGGQVWIPGLGTPKVPSAYGQRYAGGLCQGPRCRVLVSRGVGMAILPVRLGVWPEISLVTLKPGTE